MSISCNKEDAEPPLYELKMYNKARHSVSNKVYAILMHKDQYLEILLFPRKLTTATKTATKITTMRVGIGRW